VLTVETDEILVVRGGGGSMRAPCPVCRREVLMVSPDHAARIAGVSTRAIYRWVEEGAVHFTEKDTSVAICLPSLSACTPGTCAGIPAETGNTPRSKT